MHLVENRKRNGMSSIEENFSIELMLLKLLYTFLKKKKKVEGILQISFHFLLDLPCVHLISRNQVIPCSSCSMAFYKFPHIEETNAMYLEGSW